MFERGGNEMLARHEHHHIIGRIVELALVAFGTQRLHMPAHRLGVEIEVPLALALVIGFESSLIGIQ